MYYHLLLTHSYFRWAVVMSLLFALGRAVWGWAGTRPYTRTDALARVLAVITTHTQVLLGAWLYFVSPLVAYFLDTPAKGTLPLEIWFFAAIHVTLLLGAVVVLTIGSALAKRAGTDREKHRLTAIYFGAALLLILIAVPWPFSPLAARPWFR
jgi:NADH:ubiquinone oxidoreductase subunit 6 (subunit J)